MTHAAVFSIGFLSIAALASASSTVAADPYCDGLWRARNAVFARNGHCFKSPQAQAVFGKACFPPYGELSAAERKIVATIKDLERQGNCSGTAPDVGTSAASSSVPQYKVIVTLSPAAKAKLAASGETVRVAAYYFGEAKPGIPGDESGEIALSSEDKDIVNGNTITLGGLTFPEEQVAKIVGNKPQLLINVYSSRKVFSDNILDCGIWQGDAAKAATLPIACKLIGEN